MGKRLLVILCALVFILVLFVFLFNSVRRSRP